MIPPSTFGMVGPLLPEQRNGLASPSISVAAGQLPCRTYDDIKSNSRARESDIPDIGRRGTGKLHSCQPVSRRDLADLQELQSSRQGPQVNAARRNAGGDHLVHVTYPWLKWKAHSSMVLGDLVAWAELWGTAASAIVLLENIGVS